jgi:hypothetical protein
MTSLKIYIGNSSSACFSVAPGSPYASWSAESGTYSPTSSSMSQSTSSTESVGLLGGGPGGGGREASLLGIEKGVDAGRWVCGRDGWEDQPGSHGGGPSLFSIGIFLLNGITAVVSI